MYDLTALPAIQFPEGFLWGSSAAGHQIEGDNIHSQWWHREQAGQTKHKSGKACNHWELYRQDIDLLAELGHQAFRTSIEWSRIEPREGVWDEAALAHYEDEFARLKARGIKLFLTLHHFTHPQWFEELGEFQKLENLKYFERFMGKVVPRMAPYVDNWHVFNEFNIQMAGRRRMNMTRMHARGYRLIKQYSSAPVSTAHALVDYFPKRRHDRFDRSAAEALDLAQNEFFFHALRTGELIQPGVDGEEAPEVKGAIDYWAVNIYTRQMVSARIANQHAKPHTHKYLRMIDQDFYLEEFFPECISTQLDRLRDKPVYITENGVSCDDDRWRILYMTLHLHALHEAIQSGVDVRGYLHWSLLDNYEWGSFTPRFGLVQVDFETFQRTPKPSAAYYAEIIRQNGITPEMVKIATRE